MTRVLLLLILLLVRLSPAAAQEATGVQETPEGVRLDFQNADIRVVVSALADVARLNVVFSNLPQRPVTLRTSGPVTPQQVKGYLESLAQSNGLQMEEQGGLIRISGSDTPGAAAPSTPQYGRPQAQNQVRLFVYPLRHARADALSRTISALFGIGGGGAAGEPWSPGQSLSQQLRDQRAQPILPQPAPQAAAPAAPTQDAQTTGLSAGLQSGAQIVPDDRTNSLLIRSTPADYETIRTAIQALDIRPMQVLIEVLIAEVRRDRQTGLGLSVRSPDDDVQGAEIRLGPSASLIGKSGESLGSMLLRITDLGPNIDAELVLQALAASGDVTILSRPVVLAQNNQEARILVGSERPFVQLFRSLPTDNAIRDQVVQYRDVGTQLTIRPTINQDGYVSLSVLQEISTATSETQFGAPVISTREAQTELMVKDRHTAVLGGLVDNQREVAASGIPILKDLPLIGHLFRSTTRRRSSTELFLFLTPRVIRSDEDMEEVKEELKESTEVLKRRLEEGIPLLEPGDTIPPDGADGAAPAALPAAVPATAPVRATGGKG